MASSKGPSTNRSIIYSGKNPLLPPKIPHPSISPSYVDLIPSSMINSRAFVKPREENPHHQRTSSESFLLDEQPSWLDELLDEPEAPVLRGHRRSTSDSFAYLDTSSIGCMDFVTHVDNNFKNVTPFSSSIDAYGDMRCNSLYMESNMGSQNTLQDADRSSSSLSKYHDPVQSFHNDPKQSDEKSGSSCLKPSESEADTRRAKQRYAQRSRVRKLQYIAELERTIQALQAGGYDVSAELEFLNHQNLILNMENNALKQRIENLSQEQLIKHLEHEVLEREVSRLRNLYLQQQQGKTSTHRHAKSKDLDQHFSNLTLKQTEPRPWS